MRGILRMIPSSYGGNYSPLTDAWIVATSESDTTIISALRTFEEGLVLNSFVARLLAVYPFVGGNSTKHAFNFMDTANFQLTYFGGITHNANGFNPNGSTGYAKTGIIPSANMNGVTNSFGFYSRTSIAQFSVDIGSTQVHHTGSVVFTKDTDNLTYYSNNDIYGSSGNLSDTLGLISFTRNSSTVKKVFRRGVVNFTKNPATQEIVSTFEFFISADNNAGYPARCFSTRNLSFVYFATASFTDAEMLTFSNLVQELQTALNRQV